MMRACGFLLVMGSLSALAQTGEVLPLTQWRSMQGDDPRWASPSFDDRDWPRGRFSEREPTAGIVWTRTRVSIPSWWSGQRLAFAMPPVTGAYQVFVDGVELGRFGRPEKRTPEFFSPAHREFSLQQPAPASVTIALRCQFWRAPFSSARPVAVYRHEPIIGLSLAVQGAEELHALTEWADSTPDTLLWWMIALCGLLCLWMYSRRRQESEVLWLGLALLCNGGVRIINLPVRLGWIASNSTVAWILGYTPYWGVYFFYLWLLAELIPPVRTYVRILAFPVACLAITGSFAVQFLPAGPVPDFNTRALAQAVSVALGLAALLYNLRLRRWSWAALGAGTALRALAISGSGREAGTTFGAATLGNANVAVVMIAVLWARLLKRSAEQREAEQDLEAARRVQSALLGVGNPALPGFEIQTAYHSARQVGGDFYHFALHSDGSVLLATGDASGKGMQAALVVASIIGALRCEDSREPARVLTRLNRMLAGHLAAGFVTCCCIRISPDRTIHVANAGHPPPWLDGAELESAPSLPLGIESEASYEESTRQFPQHAVLTIVSDGVVEAANAKGELFGFDRTAGIANQSAQNIAQAAQAWGQNDDITVVTVRRTAA